MFPSDWCVQTNQKKKRKYQHEHRDHLTEICNGALEDSPHSPEMHVSYNKLNPESNHVATQILRTLNTVQSTPPIPDEINLDVILSRVPYKNILENLYTSDSYSVPDVPLVAKSYEESYMREPRRGERPCASGQFCECNFIDPCMPFTCVEFLLVNEDIPSSPQFCVLCCRKTTQKLFYDILLTGKEYHGVIQRYGNICGVEGEYAHECMLICPPNMPLQCMPRPIMSHQRNKYRVCMQNGVKIIEQIKVRHEDFVCPSTAETI